MIDKLKYTFARRHQRSWVKLSARWGSWRKVSLCRGSWMMETYYFVVPLYSSRLQVTWYTSYYILLLFIEFLSFGWFFPFFKKMGVWDILGATIRIGWAMLCLKYAGFSLGLALRPGQVMVLMFLFVCVSVCLSPPQKPGPLGTFWTPWTFMYLLDTLGF